MEKRYGALRIIGTIYKILGVIAGIITLLVVVGIIASSLMGGPLLQVLGRELGTRPMLGRALGGMVGGIVAAGLAIVYGVGLTLTLYGLGEGVYLLLALEENTRLTANLLQREVGR